MTTGACICGNVKFAFTGSPRFVADCVCESCRRAHGATAVSWVGVNTDQFELIEGESSLEWYASSGAAKRGFCKACGTRLFFRSDNWPAETHMALACVDSPHNLTATKVSFAEEFPDWTALALRHD